VVLQVVSRAVAALREALVGGIAVKVDVTLDPEDVMQLLAVAMQDRMLQVAPWDVMADPAVAVCVTVAPVDPEDRTLVPPDVTGGRALRADQVFRDNLDAAPVAAKVRDLAVRAVALVAVRAVAAPPLCCRRSLVTN
jgi:hypothetical protein